MTDRVTRRVRERAIGRLQRGYVCGVLGTQTFEHRVEAALTCGGRSALRQVIGDLVAPSLLERTRQWLAVPAASPSSGLLALLTTGSSTVIGRASSCDFVISDDSVSRTHAMLVRDGDRVTSPTSARRTAPSSTAAG